MRTQRKYNEQYYRDGFSPYAGGVRDLLPAPIISNLQVIDITDTSFTITWDTDIPANSVLHYGVSPNSHQFEVRNETLVLNHSLTATDLITLTAYSFEVHSRGNGTHTANSGPDVTTTI